MRRPRESTVTGLAKLLYSEGIVTNVEVADCREFVPEMRSRVEGQLTKSGGLKYRDPSLSYTDRKSGDRGFVPLSESGGWMINGESLPAGTVCTTGVDLTDPTLAPFLVRTQVNPGQRPHRPCGGNLSALIREALKAADAVTRPTCATTASTANSGNTPSSHQP
jgi:predicted ATP-dependent Lon-type protease